MTQPVPLRFREDRWEGNKWPSIDITPIDAKYFLPILTYLALHYDFEPPRIIGLLDGYAADFEILGTRAMFHFDVWTFSVAFADQAIRDRVLSDLQALPVDYFETTP